MEGGMKGEGGREGEGGMERKREDDWCKSY